jgi:hypothetical protein
LRGEIKLDSLSTPEGERRAFTYSAAWAKQQEKGNYQTTENGKRKWKTTENNRIKTKKSRPVVSTRKSFSNILAPVLANFHREFFKTAACSSLQ